MEKTCIKCGEIKPFGEFEKRSRCKDGRGNVCHKCKYESRKKLPSWPARKKAIAQACLVLGREWRKSNPEYHKEYNKEYNKNNRGYFREQHSKWRKENEAHYKMIQSTAHESGRYAKRNGIEYLPCQSCGAESKHMHHEDYEQPYRVVFLCVACHRRVHHNTIKCPKPVNLREIASG